MVGMVPDVGRWGAHGLACRTFAVLLPGVRWVNNSHADFLRFTNNPDRPPLFGYFTTVYVDMLKLDRPWGPDRKCGWNLHVKSGRFYRDYSTASGLSLPLQSLAEQHVSSELALLSHQSGPGRIGLDFWPVLQSPPGGGRDMHRGSNTISARYPESSWHQLNLQRCCEALVAPGPDGALPTVRYEVIREGIQECEARIAIERVLVDPALRSALGSDLAARCEKLLDERAKRLACGVHQCEYGKAGPGQPGWHPVRGGGKEGAADRERNWQEVFVKDWQKRREELFDCAGLVAERLRGGQ
jgi:hypothetical protein